MATQETAKAGSAPTAQTTGAAAPKKKAATASKTASRTEPKTPARKKPQQRVPEASREGLLYKFFLDALKDMYFAEKQILGGLQKMEKAATTEELQEAFEDHYLMTQKQILRLEKVFRILDEKAEGEKCEAILGILKEAESIIKETEEGSMTRDAALIIAAQKVEHYEIATYGGLVALAETLGLERAADLLDKTLQEEEDTDLHLTEIAETSINFEALEEDEDDEEA